MAEKKPIPPHIKVIDDVTKTASNVKKLADTIEAHKINLYSTAIFKHLQDKKTGYVDYEKLDDDKYGSTYHKLVADHYIKAIKDQIKADFGIKDDLASDEKINTLVDNLYGVTKADMMDLFKAHGSDLTIKNYTDIYVEDHMKKLRSRLNKQIEASIDNEHIPAILKQIGAQDYLRDKDLGVFANSYFRPGVANLISTYDKNKKLTAKDVKMASGFETYYKKAA